MHDFDYFCLHNRAFARFFGIQFWVFTNRFSASKQTQHGWLPYDLFGFQVGFCACAEDDLLAVNFDINIGVRRIFDIFVGDDELFRASAVMEDFLDACGVILIGLVAKGMRKVFKIAEVIIVHEVRRMRSDDEKFQFPIVGIGFVNRNLLFD